jgi:hypothetical protein
MDYESDFYGLMQQDRKVLFKKLNYNNMLDLYGLSSNLVYKRRVYNHYIGKKTH